MPMLYYEFNDGSDGMELLDDNEDALDRIVEIESNGPDFYIKSAWLDDMPYVGECTKNEDGSIIRGLK